MPVHRRSQDSLSAKSKSNTKNAFPSLPSKFVSEMWYLFNVHSARNPESDYCLLLRVRFLTSVCDKCALCESCRNCSFDRVANNLNRRHQLLQLDCSRQMCQGIYFCSQSSRMQQTISCRCVFDDCLTMQPGRFTLTTSFLWQVFDQDTPTYDVRSAYHPR